ncbi:PAS-domain containing protein [Curvibacter sp. APW13]|uniref:PAS-domain containing protein n=1 Tax=Curvibacter sp. APW13 TaxID=3077236 RepID=UPI0028E0966D|nr:PAS-domain containing protein [Curvibacter sp. APW13]MDT8989977.1 PAS-domain containing protein [Curvibacter sp. APW13]
MSVRDAHSTPLAPDAAFVRAMLEHLPVGITVLDSELRVVLFNQTFLEMLDLPASMFSPRLPTLEEVTRYNAERGDYGPGDPNLLTQERMARARLGRAHRFQRQRPDGRVLEISGAPMPQGGFISVYQDITEQRRVQQAQQEQALYLRSIVDHLPQGISVFDKQMRLKCWNEHLLQVLDLPADSVHEDVSFDELLMYPARRGEYGPGDPAALVAQRRAAAMQFQPHRLERTRPNGRTHLIEGRPMRKDGEVVGFVTSYTDITEQKASERELRQQSNVFQTLVDNIPGGVSLFDADLKLRASNAEFARLLEFPPELFEGEPSLERFFRFNAARGEYGQGDTETQVQQLMARARLRQPHQFTRTRPNGTILEVRGLPLSDGGFVTIYTDVTEQHHAAAAIERLAHHDTLTGLANRYHLEARLDQMVADAHRRGSKLAVMFIDMDNFKGVNDTLGHAVGDRFLCEVAARLSDSVRASDVVARIGGDEFVVVLGALEQVQDATQVADKLIHALAQPIDIDAHTLHASASVGVCFYPQDGQDRGSLMQSADIAMYHAKSAGKGVYRCFEAAMMAATTHRQTLEHRLREAVRLRQFALHYQPQVDASGRHAVGVEALIRWPQADGSMVSPLEFIPLAEELGLIHQIGEWALQTACQDMAQWLQAGLQGLHVAVNLSAIQLGNPQLAQVVARVLERTELPASALTLEVTESAAMHDPETSIARLGAIRALGVRMAIDDFGTGYSSLAYLKRLPLDYLKLDRAFVQDLEIDSNDAAICAATIGLAHNLGLQVVAEGVETAAQHQYLAGLQCDSLQGYYFSRPLPAPSVRAWLQDHPMQPLSVPDLAATCI